MKTIISAIIFLSFVSFAQADSKDVLNSVENAIKANPQMGMYELTLDYYQGLVTLNGQVQNENAKNMAEETARKVDGVTNVKNNLSVVNSMRNKMPMDNSVMARPRLQNDEAIKENLLRALKNEGALQNAQVSLDVNQGVALFSGNANTFQEVDRILAIALNMDGIRDVQSSMTVQGSKY